MVDREKIIELYLDGLSMAKVAEKTGNSTTTVHKVLNAAGVQREHGGKSKPDVSVMYSVYQSGISLREVAKRFGYKSENSISKIFKNNGLEVRTKAGIVDTLNHNYFEKIDSEKKAYILGLLLADGNITIREKSQAAIRIELKKDDLQTLELIKMEFNTQNSIAPSRDCYRIAVHSDKMSKDLSRYSIFPNKTGKKFLPIDKIEERYRSHFIRGFFDGNGWVTNTFHTLRGIKYPSTAIGFADGEQILLQLREFMENKLQLTHVSVHVRDGYSMLIYSSKRDVEKLKKFLYREATVYMQRKYDKCFGNTERD